MWQHVNHPLFGQNILAWIAPADLWDVIWKVGVLQPGQIWAQFADDGPYRPASTQ